MQIKSLTLSLLAALCIFSCELETHSNGDLDGFWQLNALDSIPQGKSVDMVPQRLFWSIEAKVLKTSDYTGKNAVLLMRFAHEGDKLRIYDPTSYKGTITDAEGMDKPLQDPAPLRPYGIQSLEETFKVLYLSGERMTLESPSLRLHFVKF